MANRSADPVSASDLRARAEERIRRAQALAPLHPAAAEPLAFFVRLTELQQSICGGHHAAVIRPSASFAESLDPESAADAMPVFLAALRGIAPAAAGAAAAGLLEASHAQWRHLVHTFWTGERDGDPLGAFLAEALLQPFAEAVAASGRMASPPGERLDRCPVCGDRPVGAVLRDAAQGSRRSFVCGFCLTEWPALRLVCAACGEQAFAKLAVHRADDYPAARVDSCESCRSYIKTIDRTKDATAVPVVDDIATVALDVWAREQGYRRLRPNLLRL